MVPAGKITQDTVDGLAKLLSPGDLIIDGGNTRFTDDIARAAALEPKGIRYMDAGTSGGIWGLTVGYCLMVGGQPDDFRRVEPILKTLAPPNGYLYCGPVGSGHYVKMVHNGIEYAVMQSYAEGFEIMKASRFELDLGAIAEPVEPGQRGAELAAGADRVGAQTGPRLAASPALGGGFRRRPLDGGGVHQYGGSGSGDRAVSDDALPLAAG